MSLLVWAIYYGWYTFRLSSRDFENLRYEIEVLHKPVDVAQVSKLQVGQENMMGKDGTDQLKKVKGVEGGMISKTR